MSDQVEPRKVLCPIPDIKTEGLVRMIGLLLSDAIIAFQAGLDEHGFDYLNAAAEMAAELARRQLSEATSITP